MIKKKNLLLQLRNTPTILRNNNPQYSNNFMPPKLLINRKRNKTNMVFGGKRLGWSHPKLAKQIPNPKKGERDKENILNRLKQKSEKTLAKIPLPFLKFGGAFFFGFFINRPHKSQPAPNREPTDKSPKNPFD